MATAAGHVGTAATTPSLRTILRAMAQTGGASLASGVLSMLAAKIVAVVLGPAQIALLSSLQQLRQTAITGATLTGQTALVQGASALSGQARREFIRTSLILMLAATVLVCGALGLFPEWIGARAGLAADQSVLAAGLVFAIIPAVAFVFVAALMNASGAIAMLAIVQLAGRATMALLAYPVARGVERGNQQLFVAILALSSFAAVLSAGASLYADRGKLRAWVAGPGGWWTGAAARRFFTISGSMFASGIFSSWIVLMVRGRVLQSQGLAIGGEFDAAWAISMNQAGLVLASLQTYYLPTLARTRDLEQRSEHISKVLTVAAALGAALIALLAAMKPVVISGFYSSQFAGAARYLRWTLAGDYLKITSWILSIPFVAMANMQAFFVADLSAYGVFAAAAFGLARWFSAAESAAIAFVLMYAAHMIFCATWLCYRGKFRADKRVVATWMAGLAVVVISSATFWEQM